MHDLLSMNPHQLVLQQPDGEKCEMDLPDFASVDNGLLRAWLYGKAKKTQIAYMRDVFTFYRTVQKPLLSIRRPDDLHELAHQLTNLKPSSRNRTMAAIKSVVTYGHKMGLLAFNAGSLVKLEKQENTLAERIMSERSVERILANETNTRNYCILSLLYYAGLRAQEICNLQWRHLQERDDAGQLEITGKGKKTRYILLERETWQEVQSLKTPSSLPGDYVFLSRQQGSRTGKKDRRLDESMIDEIVKQAAIRVNIEVYITEKGEKRTRVSPHWFRHAHATYAQEHGAPISLVQATLGHKSIETTAKYSHVRPKESSTRYLRGRS